jgi:hypothetical protein
MSFIQAPWTDEEVAALNRWQELGYAHPFTCSESDSHPLNGGYEDRLVAENDGWHCPTCGHTQNWAHDFMLRVPHFTYKEPHTP